MASSSLLAAQFLGERDEIYGTVALAQRAHVAVNPAVRIQREIVRLQQRAACA